MKQYGIMQLQIINLKRKQSRFDSLYKDYQLWMLLEGSIHLINRDADLFINESDIFLVPPGEELEVITDASEQEDGCTAAMLLLDAAYFEEHVLVPSIGLNKETISAAGISVSRTVMLTDNADELRISFINMISTCRKYDSENDIHVKSALYDLLISIEELLKHGSLTGPNEAITVGENERRRLVELYLRKHSAEKLSLKKIANAFFLSPEYFSRYFNREFGVSLTSYLNRIRLENAAARIAAGEGKLNDIARESGFSSVAHMGKLFREKYQCTMTEYRSKYADTNENEINIHDAAVEDSRIDDILDRIRKQSVLEQDPASRKVLTVEADCKNSIIVKNPCREILNIDQPMACLDSTFQSQLVSAQQDMHFYYARINRLFSGDLFNISEDMEITEFHDFDRIIRMLLSAGLKPHLELGTKPRAIRLTYDAIKLELHKYYSNEQWANILNSLILHCVDIWGVSEVDSWRFELWLPQSIGNEADPEVVRSFYAERFIITYQIIHRYLDNAAVGGPGINYVSGSEQVLRSILRNVKDRGIKPDFISFDWTPEYVLADEKGWWDVKLSGIVPWKSGMIIRTANEINRITYDIYKEKIPLLMTEFSTERGTRSLLNESAYKAALFTSEIMQAWMLDAAGYASFSDISFEDANDIRTQFGGSGLMTDRSIRRPMYYALRFLCRVGQNLVASGKNYIITSESNHEYSILIHNLKELQQEYFLSYFRQSRKTTDEELFVDTEDLNMTISMRNVNNGEWRIKYTVLNDQHGNAYQMAEELHFPKVVTPEDIEFIRETAQPLQYYKNLKVNNNILTIYKRLIANEVCMVKAKLISRF